MVARLRWVMLLALVLLLGPGLALAEDLPPDGGGSYEPPRDLTTEDEWAKIATEVADNIARLEADGRLSALSTEAVSFRWPLRAAAHLTDYGYYGVSGFMDHNPATGAVLDYTCGDRSYDLSSGYDHQGSDYFTYPYPWLKMDNFEVEIVAAAPGTLAFRRDGQYDRQCAMTGALSNAVVIRHADGSLAHYLHMKNGSVTTKAVGAPIAAGEYLGIVGSSGSSTGPHLHFEVRDSTNTYPVDPYYGDCNASPSLWAAQPPYYDSVVTKVQIGDAPPVRPACPSPEIPNIQDTFEPEDRVYFVTFYRDQLAGQQSRYRVLRPDGSQYSTWTHAVTYDHYSASYWYWSMTLDRDGVPPGGTWRFEVDFEGETYETTFTMAASTRITVTHPDGGEVWPPGTLLPIVWEDDLAGDVAIDLYAAGVFHTRVITATPSDGVHLWGPPADLEPRADYQVRVADATDPAVFDVSDAPFTISPPPTASFNADPVTGIVPLTVVFADTSAPLVDSRLWAFGDGVTATLQHPAHTYADVGVYTVTLAVTGPAGSDILTRTNAITVTPPPLAAAFTAWPILGLAPLDVTFTDRSNGPPAEEWAWTFGDGMTSTLQHPTHIYTETGVYTVTLVVATSEEEDEAVRSRYIHVVDEVWSVYLPAVLR